MFLPNAIRVEKTPDGYAVRRQGARLGSIFLTASGWVATGRSCHRWRRTGPYKTASVAADRRWGPAARIAVEACETNAKTFETSTASQAA